MREGFQKLFSDGLGSGYGHTLALLEVDRYFERCFAVCIQDGTDFPEGGLTRIFQFTAGPLEINPMHRNLAMPDLKTPILEVSAFVQVLNGRNGPFSLGMVGQVRFPCGCLLGRKPFPLPEDQGPVL